MNFEKIKNYKYHILVGVIILIGIALCLYFLLSKKSNDPNDGEGFIFSFSSSYLIDSLNIESPSDGDLSTMPSGISLLGSNNDTWSVLYTNKSINWNTGSNVFQVNATKPYSLFALVITSLSKNNNGLVGKIKLMSGNSSIISDSGSYNTSTAGTYMSYPGYKFNKIGLGNFSVSYTPSITTTIGSISTDNIQKLVFSDLGSGTFGVLNSNTTYSNGKYNGPSIFKIEN